MRAKDFEKAILGLGISGLVITEMKMTFGYGGHIGSVYGKIGELTYLMWDANGRSFRFDINPEVEGCTVVSHPEFLNYRRDVAFDLHFD